MFKGKVNHTSHPMSQAATAHNTDSLLGTSSHHHQPTIGCSAHHTEPPPPPPEPTAQTQSQELLIADQTPELFPAEPTAQSQHLELPTAEPTAQSRYPELPIADPTQELLHAEPTAQSQQSPTPELFLAEPTAQSQRPELPTTEPTAQSRYIELPTADPTLEPPHAEPTAQSQQRPLPNATLPGAHQGYTTWLPTDDILHEAITEALHWAPPPWTDPLFIFELTTEAAEHNFTVLKSFNFDLQAAIMSDPASQLFPGSEWTPAPLLEPIFRGHPLWHKLVQHLEQGVSWHCDPIPDDERLEDLETTILYGNHKSAGKEDKAIMKGLRNEVIRGWQLPLPVEKLHLIPGAVVVPLGYAHQFSIDEEGNRISKGRITTDQSHPRKPNRSVNARVRESELSPCEYGHTMSRHLHRLVALRRQFPDLPILQGKGDFKSAYKRLHLDGESAVQGIVTTKDLDEHLAALMSLRQNFGAKPGPSVFSDFSTPLTDLANGLARSAILDDPRVVSRYTTLIGPPKILPPTVPFGPARPLLVEVEADGYMTANNFIDDIIQSFVYLSAQHSTRASEAMLLAFDILACPLQLTRHHLPLARDDILSLAKLMAEGTPTELLIVLGWLINSHAMEISLPEDKHRTWSHDLTSMLHRSNHVIQVKEMRTLMGRLNNVSSVLPIAAHFRNNLYCLLGRCEKYKKSKSTAEERQDMTLWQDFLDHVRDGVDINLLTHRHPNQICVTDACTTQLGGFSATSGRGWRWPIPDHLHHRKHINFLEFLACITGILLEIFEGRTQPGDAFLSVGDNTTAAGWLMRSNFAPRADRPAHGALARYFARTMLKNQLCNYSQWWAGRHNQAADTTSRDKAHTDTQLTQLILSQYPEQVPKNFKISPLPDEIICILSYWVQLEAQPKGCNPVLTPRQTGIGPDGSTSSAKSTSMRTPTSLDSPLPPSSSSSERSRTRLATDITPNQDPAGLMWAQTLAKPPSIRYQRPSLPRTDLTPAAMMTAPQASPSSDSSAATNSMTLEPSTNNASPSN